MSACQWFSFDPRVSGDGLLTFFGGLLAFFAIIYQVRQADKGLQRQLDAEKKARQDAANARSRAVATAVLFEIDDHYRSNIRDLLQVFETQAAGVPIVLKPISANPLPVYAGNVTTLGELPSTLVEAIVQYYGVLRVYLGTLSQYSQGYDLMVQGNQLGMPIMKSLIHRIKSEAKAIIQPTYTVCGLLCSFLGTTFSFPRVAVANDPNVEDDARGTLEASRKELALETGTK